MKFAILLTGYVIVQLILVWTMIGFIFRKLWSGIAKDFPPREVIEPSIYRPFQSFEINAMSLGSSVHVSLDDECLHLRPAKLVRWMGLTPISIPWEQIEIDQAAVPKIKRRFFPNMIKARIGKHKIVGPRWCFEMVLDHRDA